MQYTLETFTENRSTSWDQEPYRGKAVAISSTALYAILPVYL